jgi:hypothetical protein
MSGDMKGVITIDRLYATPKRQQNLASILQEHGFRCELRVRFDGLHIVAFEKDGEEPDPAEAIYRLLHDSSSWHEEDCRIKMLG